MDIDFVYLWVDGNDPVWKAKKTTYLPEQKLTQDEAVGECRYVSNDELKYSLRSLEKYAPWIRNIYIVTDNQCPSWLDISNPRIRIVDHREIIPAEYLPLFNGLALEPYIARIPGLSEHFLYSNDDGFFGAPVDPSFFFDKKGRPFVRLRKQKIRSRLDHLYAYTVFTAQQESLRRFGKEYRLAPHHNIDAYNLSTFKEGAEEYREWIALTSQHRFRQREDMLRVALDYYALAKGKAVLRKVSRFNGARNPWQFFLAAIGRKCSSDSRYITMAASDLSVVINKYNPKLFCINDGEAVNSDHRARVRQFMETMFPQKSAFEK